MKLVKTAVTEWQAANVGHTQVNLNASVRRAIMGKAYNMNAQVSCHLVCFSTSHLLLCKEVMLELNNSKL